MEKIVKRMGFESEAEFHQLVSSVDLSNPTRLAMFLAWKQADGTKQGLLKLFPLETK